MVNSCNCLPVAHKGDSEVFHFHIPGFEIFVFIFQVPTTVFLYRTGVSTSRDLKQHRVVWIVPVLAGKTESRVQFPYFQNCSHWQSL